MAPRRKTKTQDEFDLSLRGQKPIKPKTLSQARYQRSIQNNVLTVGVGLAGTGKTFMAAVTAAELLASNKIKRIVVMRPAVALEDEEHGFLPGGIEAKLRPWVRPIVDALKERLGEQDTISRLKAGQIEAIPFTYLRGMSFSDTFIILTEAQNTTPAQAKAFVTRVGENTKVVVEGDPSQSDKVGLNGLQWITSMIEKGAPGTVVRFSDPADVVRSDFVRQWLEKMTPQP